MVVSSTHQIGQPQAEKTGTISKEDLALAGHELKNAEATGG